MTYHDALEAGEQYIKKFPERDASRIELMHSWLSSTVTQELFEQLSSKADELEKQARELACTYHQHQNHQHIISCLIKATELRKVITDYGSAK